MARGQSRPKNQESSVSIIQGKVEWGEGCLLPHSGADVKAHIFRPSLWPCTVSLGPSTMPFQSCVYDLEGGTLYNMAIHLRCPSNIPFYLVVSTVT